MTDARLRRTSLGPAKSATAADPPGFAPLLCIDTTNGWHNGSTTLYVPLALAEGINAARAVLHGQSEDRRVWARACVMRTSPFEDEPSDDPAGSDARQEAIPPLSLQNRPAQPSGPPTSAAAPARKRKRHPVHGRHARVIPAAAVAQRRQRIGTQFKYTAAERKAEQQAMDELLERGEHRIVGLKQDWLQRLARLRSDMPNFSSVVERIQAACAVAVFSRTPLRIPPLLLAGPPGVDKTHFALRLSDVLGVGRFVYPLESAETVSALQGSDKHWSNSEPGELYRQIVQGTYANPVVVLDEIDKAHAGSNYKPVSALHAVLEPLTASQLRDKSVDIEFDASFVVYVATANRLSTIDSSLLSRFEIFLIEEPDARAAVSIARAIGRQVLADLKVDKRFAAPAGEVLQQLALIGSPRRVRKALLAAIGRALLAGRRRVELGDLLPEDGDEGPH